MRNRRLVPLIAAASVAVVAAAGCGSSSAAVTVDDQSISRQDFEESLEFVYENEELLPLLFEGGDQIPSESLRAEDDAPGVYTQAFAGGLAGRFVQYLVAEQIVDELDLDVSESSREQIEEALTGAVEDVPDSLRDRLVAGQAAIDVVQNGDPAEVNDAADRLVDDVEVSSRYGTWNADEFTVDPPAGPRPAPGTEDTPDGQPLDGAELPAG